MSLEQLRAEHDRLSKELERIEGRQESTQVELARLEQKARELGFDPDDLDTAINQLLDDAKETLAEVGTELTALGEETGVRTA